MSEQLSFFNTPGLKSTDLEVQKRAKQTQNDRVLGLFEIHTDGMTPHAAQVLTGISIVSVRRAITTLTYLGKLEKTNQQVKEREGILNYIWRVPR